MPPHPEPEKIKEKDPLEAIVTSLALRIVAANISVSVSKTFGVELERATKKPPPRQTSVALVFTGREAWEEGELADGGKATEDAAEEGKGEKSVFRGLRADLDGRGLAKVFIGHATGQTTGMAGHLSARFIPTVERESIDLVDRHVAVWNRELLHVAGAPSSRSSHTGSRDTDHCGTRTLIRFPLPGRLRDGGRVYRLALGCLVITGLGSAAARNGQMAH